MNIENLKKANKTRWDKLVISNTDGPAFKRVADMIIQPSNMERYKAVEKLTNVPWWFVAVVHYREASMRWDTQLAQGDPLNRKSKRIPKGRGPFKTWEEGAVDALVNCHPYAARNKDWSVGGALALLEQYNGLGYANKGLPSPYLWAKTNQYTKGKYVADGVYDPDHVDTQLGCAGILKFLGVFNKTDVIVGATAVAGAGIATYLSHFWDHFVNNWFTYTSTFAVAVTLIGLIIYLGTKKNV